MTAQIIAAFDFDRTLTDRDSLLPFLFYFKGFWKAIYQLTALTPAFIQFFFGYLSRQEIKEKILTRFLKGKPYDRISHLGKKYADERLDRYLRPQALKRLAWHQSQGHHCILVSASLDFYLRPWGLRHGFQEVLASQLELTSSQLITGKLSGLNCWGAEKKRRLMNYLGKQKNYELYVYGDSQGDKEILEIAHHPFYRKFS